MSETYETLELGAEESMQGKFLTFAVGEDTYGIEISFVTEIIGIQGITRVPELPAYMKGIVNLRGTIIPIMDVRLRFNVEPKAYDERTCIIVVSFSGVAVGLVVDTVQEVVAIQDADIVLPPRLRGEKGNQYIKGIGKVGEDSKLLIDCHRLFGDVEGLLEESGL